MQVGKNSILLLVPLLFLLSGCEQGADGVVSLLTGGSDGGGGSSISLSLIDPGGSGGGGGYTGEDENGSGGGSGGGSGDVGGSDNTLVNPEPGSMLLFGTGLLGSALSRSRLRRFFKKKA